MSFLLGGPIIKGSCTVSGIEDSEGMEPGRTNGVNIYEAFDLRESGICTLGDIGPREEIVGILGIFSGSGKVQ
jgi:hypothetical protein